MCEQCEAVMINGVYCHEHGCPIAWKDIEIECTWCGRIFIPESEYQVCCSNECGEAFC